MSNEIKCANCGQPASFHELPIHIDVLACPSFTARPDEPKLENNMEKLCPDCGSELDDYGCLGFDVHDYAIQKKRVSQISNLRKMLELADKVLLLALCTIGDLADQQTMSDNSYLEDAEEIRKARTEIQNILKKDK